MGFIIIILAAVAGLVGLAATAVLGSLAIVVYARSGSRSGPWGPGRVAGAAIMTLALAAALAYAIRWLPLLPVRPGSDYDNAAISFMVQAFGFTLAPGLAAILIAWLATRRHRIRPA